MVRANYERLQQQIRRLSRQNVLLSIKNENYTVANEAKDNKTEIQFTYIVPDTLICEVGKFAGLFFTIIAMDIDVAHVCG